MSFKVTYVELHNLSSGAEKAALLEKNLNAVQASGLRVESVLPVQGGEAGDTFTDQMWCSHTEGFLIVARST